MSKFNEQMDKAMAQLDKLGAKYDKSLLEKIGKGLGPALYNADAAYVAFTSKTEVETVMKNFVMNKLGCTDQDKAQQVMDKVAEKMKGVNKKHRVNVYYMLVKELGMEKAYA